MTKIKLCGMMRPADTEAACAVHPDYAGMILSAGFRRSVSREMFLAMQQMLAENGIRRVGVFVNESLQTITAHYAAQLDVIQLHGQEDAAYIRELKRKTGLEIIKAFRIASPADLQAAAESKADHVLLDSGTGTGIALDWSMLRGFSRPYFLAGGLHPENVADAVKMLHPYAVDVSSGIEINGQKSAERMQAFASAVRRAGSRFYTED